MARSLGLISNVSRPAAGPSCTDQTVLRPIVLGPSAAPILDDDEAADLDHGSVELLLLFGLVHHDDDLVLSADLAFARGRYEEAEAEARYERAVALHDGFTANVGLALYRWKSADFDATAQSLDRAAQRIRGDDPEPLGLARAGVRRSYSHDYDETPAL